MEEESRETEIIKTHVASLCEVYGWCLTIGQLNTLMEQAREYIESPRVSANLESCMKRINFFFELVDDVKIDGYKYSTMGPEPHSVPDPEVPVVTNLTLRNKKEPEKESHPEIDQASSEGKDPEVSIAAELSTDESEEEAGAIPSDWIEINHYGSSPLYKKKYGDTLDARADIIDAVYILILEIGVPQLIVIIDLLYQRLCSEKVPGEFFPFRESVWHMLFLSKKELMRDESVAKNRKVDERFKLGTFVSGVESEIQNLKVNETLPIGTLVSGVESPVLGMRGREEKWISDDLRCHQG